MTKELRGPGLHIDLLLSLHCVSVLLGNTDVEDTFQFAIGVPCLECPVLPWLTLTPTGSGLALRLLS